MMIPWEEGKPGGSYKRYIEGIASVRPFRGPYTVKHGKVLLVGTGFCGLCPTQIERLLNK
jgi:hypothetical protein